jgi:hypothetical protein
LSVLTIYLSKKNKMLFIFIVIPRKIVKLQMSEKADYFTKNNGTTIGKTK